jgi:hypothetical protein
VAWNLRHYEFANLQRCLIVAINQLKDSAIREVIVSDWA